MTEVYCDSGVYVIEHEDGKGDRQELRMSSLEARKLKRQLNALIAGD